MKTFIHLSDLHFSQVSFNPLQIFSKRWIGNLNLCLFRKRQLQIDRTCEFIDYIQSIRPEFVLISGDFTTTALSHEYKKAMQFLIKLKNLGIKVYGIPGNHDAYTKKSFHSKSFYQHFKGLLPFKGEFDFDLERHKVAAFLVDSNHYLVLVDASCYTPYFQSNGVFTFEIEQHLQALLETIPQDAKVWLACHYPFFEHENKRRVLLGAKNLRKIIERYSQIELFFHGHTHRQAICDLRSNDLPIISDSGSLTLKNRSTFNKIRFNQKEIELSRFHHESHFVPIETHTLKRK
jgi:3',5'-cyclic AMP phosphodiesterase CpdA